MSSAPFIQDSPSVEEHKNAWAKYDRHSGGWLPLYRHLDDIACVAAALWDTWLTPNSKALICDSFDGDENFGRQVAVFLASGHDIGKCSSAFAIKVPECASRMTAAGAVFLTLDNADIKSMPHGTVSALSLIDWLESQVQPEDCFAIESLSTIVGGHHGIFPSKVNLLNCFPYTREKETHWHKDRLLLWERAAKTAGFSQQDLVRLTKKPLSQTAQMTLCGFIIMSDWIASNTQWFPLDDYRSSKQRAEIAFASLHFPRPWLASPPIDDLELFQNSFSLQEGSAPRPVQKAAMELARKSESPCLILIEAPTGEGKTEAAFTAAEILASRFNLSGITIALPTCATSDAMFPRMLRWLENRLPSDKEASTVLCHGKAQYNEEYTGLFSKTSNEFSPIYGEEAENKASLIPHWWFSGRKTSALSDFTIGTIDQVLFGALRSRHLALRHLGFSSKVVILDEIHCADSYMSVYLDRILTWLGAMGTPVIALSATLDPKRRGELLSAYRAGACKNSRDPYKRHAAKSDLNAAYEQRGYPLISVSNSSEVTFSNPRPSGRTTQFNVKFLGSETSTLIGKILQLSGIGGCVGVVCNTVSRAQQVYEEVKQKITDDVEIVLLHSRFSAYDRRRIEKSIVERLGPNADNRPSKLVVVSTQVIEQSMDIDFDCMISDIAPMDLIFQRAGRLHRHHRPQNQRPLQHQLPTLYVSGCDAPTEEESPFVEKGSSFVYGQASLLRSLRVLQLHDRTIKSPDDVANFVRLSYSSSLTPPGSWMSVWEEANREAEEENKLRKIKAKQYLLPVPAIKEPVWEIDSLKPVEAREEIKGHAQVRDIEDSLDVILIEKATDHFQIPSWVPKYGNTKLDFHFPIPEEESKILAMCTVPLPQWVLKGKIGEALLDALELCVFSEEEVFNISKNKWLKEQLFLPLTPGHEATVAGLHFSYSTELGMKVTSANPE